MKAIIPLFFLWIPLLINAQYMITSVGVEGEEAIWGVGETITATLSNESSNLLLTQGFLQPELFILSGIIHSQSKTVSVKAYPNPINDKLFIDTGNHPYSWRLLDSLGKVLDTGTLSGNFDEFINTSNYASGVYVLVVVTAKGSTSIKIIK